MMPAVLFHFMTVVDFEIFSHFNQLMESFSISHYYETGLCHVTQY